MQETSFMTPPPHISAAPYPTLPHAVNTEIKSGLRENDPPAYDAHSPSEDQVH